MILELWGPGGMRVFIIFIGGSHLLKESSSETVKPLDWMGGMWGIDYRSTLENVA